jgi:hypothetical protein
MKLAKKKQEDKMIMWQEIRDNEENKLAEEKRKTDFEEQRCLLDENKMRQWIIVEEKAILWSLEIVF